MHYFIYQASRHHSQPLYGRKINTTTIRNDFNLETMKKGLKGRYTIHGFTTHPFHKLLKEMNLQDLMKGHIIEVPEAKYAIWLKLNYDQIGKGSTRYIASYQGIQVGDLEPMAEELAKIQTDLTRLQTSYYAINGVTNSLNSFVVRANKVDIPNFTKDVLSKAESLLTDINQMSVKITEESAQLRERILQINQQVRDYLKNHEM